MLWFGSIASSYCAVVVAVMADRRLRGEKPRVSDGMAVANARFGRILAWTLVSIAAGLVVAESGVGLVLLVALMPAAAGFC